MMQRENITKISRTGQKVAKTRFLHDGDDIIAVSCCERCPYSYYPQQVRKCGHKDGEFVLSNNDMKLFHPKCPLKEIN